MIRLSPGDPEALNNRCWARAIVGDLDNALKDCHQALQLRPRYGDAFDSRGFVNLKIGRTTNAIDDYNAALSIDPRRASSLYGRGIAKRAGAMPRKNDIAAAKPSRRASPTNSRATGFGDGHTGQSFSRGASPDQLDSMKLLLEIAWTHVTTRIRQTLVGIVGVAIGVDLPS